MKIVTHEDVESALDILVRYRQQNNSIGINLAFDTELNSISSKEDFIILLKFLLFSFEVNRGKSKFEEDRTIFMHSFYRMFNDQNYDPMLRRFLWLGTEPRSEIICKGLVQFLEENIQTVNRKLLDEKHRDLILENEPKL